MYEHVVLVRTLPGGSWRVQKSFSRKKDAMKYLEKIKDHFSRFGHLAFQTENQVSVMKKGRVFRGSLYKILRTNQIAESLFPLVEKTVRPLP